MDINYGAEHVLTSRNNQNDFVNLTAGANEYLNIPELTTSQMGNNYSIQTVGSLTQKQTLHHTHARIQVDQGKSVSIDQFSNWVCIGAPNTFGTFAEPWGGVGLFEFNSGTEQFDQDTRLEPDGFTDFQNAGVYSRISESADRIVFNSSPTGSTAILNRLTTYKIDGFGVWNQTFDADIGNKFDLYDTRMLAIKLNGEVSIYSDNSYLNNWVLHQQLYATSASTGVPVKVWNDSIYVFERNGITEIWENTTQLQTLAKSGLTSIGLRNRLLVLTDAAGIYVYNRNTTGQQFLATVQLLTASLICCCNDTTIFYSNGTTLVSTDLELVNYETILDPFITSLFVNSDYLLAGQPSLLNTIVYNVPNYSRALLPGTSIELNNQTITLVDNLVVSGNLVSLKPFHYVFISSTLSQNINNTTETALTNLTTVVNIDTEYFEYLTSTIRIKRTGFYKLFGRFRWNPSIVGFRRMRFTINSVGQEGFITSTNVFPSTFDYLIYGYSFLVENDVIGTSVLQTSGAVLAVTLACQLKMYYIGNS